MTFVKVTTDRFSNLILLHLVDSASWSLPSWNSPLLVPIIPHLPSLPPSSQVTLHLLPLLAPSLSNLYNFEFLTTLPWGVFSSYSISSLHANNSQISISGSASALRTCIHNCQLDISLDVWNLTKTKMNSSSVYSLPPKSIFPSVFYVLVNGTFIHPAAHDRNLESFLTPLSLTPNLPYQVEYFCWVKKISASVFLLQRERILYSH